MRSAKDNYLAFLETKKLVDESYGFEPESINSMLYDFQRDIVMWAVRKGRSAIFADCGLGKTPMQLEWSKHVCSYIKGSVLILAPLAVTKQTQREGKKFGIEVIVCRSQEDVRDGINITNYEMLHKFDADYFKGVVLDESSILKSFQGKFRNQIIESFVNTPFKLACTATPAPNDYMELGNHSEFLGIHSRSEMLSLFFVNDAGDTGKWRLKGHAQDDFWRWLCSWAVMIKQPSDLGYEDGKFKLPNLKIDEIVVKSRGIVRKGHSGFLEQQASTLGERREARRNSITDRVNKAKELIDGGSDEPWLIWCNLNVEADTMTKAVDGASEIKGADDHEYKEKAMLDFVDGDIRVLVTKPKIAGFGVNWQHCSNVIFLGLSDSYESFYQAMRRCWRFGQEREVKVYIIISSSERSVIDNVMRKEQEAKQLHEGMIGNMKKLSEESIRIKKRRLLDINCESDTTEGKDWTMYLGDCVDVCKKLESESIDYSLFSPPFSSLFTYTDSVRDMGNSNGDEEFFEHFIFLIKELYRLIVPGRMVGVHCMNLPMTITHHGTIGIRDFRGDIIRAFQKEGFIYYSEVLIWKNPLIQAVRTKMLQLAHKQIIKDSARCSQGGADYIVSFRKPGVNPKPVARQRGFERYVGEMDEPNKPKLDDPAKNKYSHEVWQRYASPVWFDIRQTHTLNERSGREEKDEKHICPLQLDVIERCLELWTRPGDVVFSPFAGIGSELYMAVKMGRKGLGVELKKSYFFEAIKNLKRAEREVDGKVLKGFIF